MFPVQCANGVGEVPVTGNLSVIACHSAGAFSPYHGTCHLAHFSDNNGDCVMMYPPAICIVALCTSHQIHVPDDRPQAWLEMPSVPGMLFGKANIS